MHHNNNNNNSPSNSGGGPNRQSRNIRTLGSNNPRNTGDGNTSKSSGRGGGVRNPSASCSSFPGIGQRLGGTHTAFLNATRHTPSSDVNNPSTDHHPQSDTTGSAVSTRGRSSASVSHFVGGSGVNASASSSSSSAECGGLAKDLINFFQKQCDRDVKIVCESRTFMVNSVILSARSPVFHKMLQGDFVEGHSRTINISDVPMNVVDNFVDALTCDSCQLLRDGPSQLRSLISLYLLADQYQFLTLTKRCEARLHGLVTKASVFDVLEAAETTNSQILKRRCMEVLQSFRGAEMFALLRGNDLWSDLRDMRVNIETTVPTNRALGSAMTGSLNAGNGGGVVMDVLRKQAEVLCCEHDTIETLKSLIAAVWPIAVDRQRLVFSGKPLDDERTLFECGIQLGATIFVLEVSRRRRHRLQQFASSNGGTTANASSASLPFTSTAPAVLSQDLPPTSLALGLVSDNDSETGPLGGDGTNAILSEFRTSQTNGVISGGRGGGGRRGASAFGQSDDEDDVNLYSSLSGRRGVGRGAAAAAAVVSDDLTSSVTLA